MICQNVCVFSGRVGNDVEVIGLDSGAKILKFPLAIDRPSKKEDGTWDSNTSWADMEYFENTESGIGNRIRNLEKGQVVAVHCSYQEKKKEIDGVNRSFKSFKVQNVFTEPKKRDQEQDDMPYE